ncbi:MAG: SH3 domain-containing protein [Anaerolineae bacterium]|nr:SH3 domain-containing protein [Anaerolineae bacterium]
MHQHNRWAAVFAALVLLFTLGCSVGRLIAGKPTPTPTLARTPRPTFTPTPFVAPTATPIPPTPAPEPATPTPTPEPLPPTDTPTPPPPTDTPVPPTPTPEPLPFIVVTSDRVNVRSGPGTSYPRVGQVTQGQRLDIVGKNPAGDWWQVCCVNGQQVWITGNLVQAQGNLGRVAVAANIPTPPPTARPQPTATPAPTATPVPQYDFRVLRPAEGRVNTNPLITVWIQLYDKLDNAAGGYVVRVTRGGVTVGEATTVYAEGAKGGWLWAYGGLPNMFIYNAKIELPLVEGAYEAYILSGGRQVSEPIGFTVAGDTREFILTWKQK